jgi:uncharacterized protein (DUF1778 family)
MASATARLDVRLSKRLKNEIARAAEARGQTITNFVVTALGDAARKVLQEENVTVLGARDRDAFLAMLDADREPNQALKRAAKFYKEHVKLAD